jgi:hypothetical protein
MAAVEQYTPVDSFENMPKPGSMAHLEWLSQLEIPEALSLEELKSFLEGTRAVNSFVRFTRQHRMVPHLPRRHRAEFDTRLLGLGSEVWSPVFRCAIEISPELPDHGLLLIHGRPYPGRSPNRDYTYDVVLPVKDRNFHDPSYDPSHPMEAMYSWHQHKNLIDRRRRGFCEISQVHQGEPAVVSKALQEAAQTACDLYRYLYGEDMILSPTEPSAPEVVHWHPDYATDDPNEFIPSSRAIAKAITRIKSMRPWQPDYLKDDPNEFLKAS